MYTFPNHGIFLTLLCNSIYGTVFDTSTSLLYVVKMSMTFGRDDAILIKISLSAEILCMEILVLTFLHYSLSTDGGFRTQEGSQIATTLISLLAVGVPRRRPHRHSGPVTQPPLSLGANPSHPPFLM